MGEMLPVMLARIDDVSAFDVGHLTRPPSRQIVEQVWITTSGIFTQPPFIAALHTFGVDRIMFSVDYPYSHNGAFLDQCALSPSRHGQLTHGNADALLRLQA